MAAAGCGQRKCAVSRVFKFGSNNVSNSRILKFVTITQTEITSLRAYKAPAGLHRSLLDNVPTSASSSVLF